MQHIRKMAQTQGLILDSAIVASGGATKSQDSDLNSAESEQRCLDPNLVVQLFSPLVTSQRIMGSQFKNSYESITCEDGTTLVFEELSNFIFLCIGTYSESYLQRFMSVAIQMVKLIVGPCISLLKFSRKKSKMLDSLLAAWLELYAQEQSYLVEAIERFIVNSEISSTSISVLSTLLDTILRKNNIGSGHAMFFAQNKLLTLYSSKNAEELCESDLLALNLLLKATSLKDATFSGLSVPPSLDEQDVAPSLEEIVREEDIGEEDEELDPGEEFGFLNIKEEGEIPSMSVQEFLLLLKTKRSTLSPHVVYLYSLTTDFSLIIVTEINRSQLSASMLEVFDLLEALKSEESCFKDVPFIDTIDASLRKFKDSMNCLPKNTQSSVKKHLGQVSSRWDSLKKAGLEEWLKTASDPELPSRMEAVLSSLIEAVRSTWGAACLGASFPSVLKYLEAAAPQVLQRMGGFASILGPRGQRETSLESCSIISINKYLEEFPGLVHFLYIDRSVHQLTAPLLWVGQQSAEEHSSENTDPVNSVRRLTGAKVWSMVGFARDHLSKGYNSLLWKDKTFSYSYFLWFEDKRGNPLKPGILTCEELEELPLPGVLCGDFYKALAAKAFPDTPSDHLRIFELFCIHLGMTTSPCILEQTRRLAATVWEIAGPSSANPIDLL